jgi:Flp pilus assembly protein TadD
LRSLLGIALLWHSSLCFAQENEPSPARRARPERSADPATAERLRKFSDAFGAGRDAEARRRGEELLRSRLSPFERGNVERALADLAQREERWADAREHLRKALASEGLNEQESDAARYQIADLFWREERWQEGIEAWNEWARMALAPPNGSAYGSLARAYYQLEDFERALDPARKAVELSKQQSPPLLNLLVAVQLKRGAYEDAARLLRSLLGLAPVREHWVRLAAVDLELGNEAEAAQALQIAYYGGVLAPESDLRSLAQLLVQIGIPYRAGRILSAAIESKSVTADAKLYQLLGETWIVAHEYGRAIEPLRLALSSEALRDPCRARFLLGIALYRQGEPNEARRWLERTLECPGSPGRSWLLLLDSETMSLSR